MSRTAMPNRRAARLWPSSCSTTQVNKATTAVTFHTTAANPSERESPAMSNTSNRNVPCTRMGIPATLAIWKDHRITSLFRASLPLLRREGRTSDTRSSRRTFRGLLRTQSGPVLPIILF